jgi:hypothetical protein
MKRAFLVITTLTTVALCSCSKGTSVPEGAQATAAATSAPQNTTNFPLIAGSTVLVSKGFSQTVNAGQSATGVMSAGAGTYNGNEVIAGSDATLAQLESWLRENESKPPSGYVAVAIPASMATIHSVAVKNGMDFAIFHDTANSKHGLIVVALDPQAAHNKLGPALFAVSKYQALPVPMKQQIDSQLKQRYGYTASEFVEAGSPLGSAAAAMSQFKDKNQRAIIVLDATKQ